MEPVDEDVRTVAGWLRGAARVLFVTGAGLSADSGLPTYRGTAGLYEQADTEEGIPIEEALSGGMLRRRPELTWRYIAEIERACRGAAPNAGHHAMVEVERRAPSTLVITQNVDGLHQAAGSREVIEIHGSLRGLSCTGCPERRALRDYAGLEIPPRCAACGAVLRPDVVLFGEALPRSAVERYVSALEAGFDLVLSVGTTSVFPYIAEPVLRARRAGVPSVEINPGESAVSHVVTRRLRARASEVLPAIVAAAYGS